LFEFSYQKAAPAGADKTAAVGLENDGRVPLKSRGTSRAPPHPPFTSEMRVKI
jgi:hypothetical protein